MSFTFKTQKPVGKWKSFESDYHQIKLDGFEVGSIDDKTPHKINLMVLKDDVLKSKNPNCVWKFITLKKEFQNIKEAKVFLATNFELINSQFNIFKLEN